MSRFRVDPHWNLWRHMKPKNKQWKFNVKKIIFRNILDLHVGHVGGEAQKNILSILLWAPASVGEKHCHMY